MLSFCHRETGARARPLNAAEDTALRAAFGRYGRATARAEGAAVVRRYQHSGPGHWFLCDCVPGGDAPALIPVLETFVRRHAGAGWPAHDPECDFARDGAEQAAIVRSYAPMADGAPIRLVRAFIDPDQVRLRTGTHTVSIARGRGTLGRLLTHLATAAGLQHLGEDGRFETLTRQFAALRRAAAEVMIDDDLPLARYFCTYPPALPELIGRVARADGQFSRARPHGVLIMVVTAIERGALIPAVGEPKMPVPVRGRIAVWAEREGHGRETDAASARAPYLACCLVGRATAAGPVEVLAAYLHPCVAPARLMLVDSNLERGTLDQILSVQAWLGRNRGVGFTIDKPLFDIGPDFGAEAAVEGPGTGHVRQEQGRAPCIPDWIVRVRAAPRGGSATVIVETMGYDDPAYRARKAATHALMADALTEGTARPPLVLHDHHLPADLDQAGRDRRLWRDLRWAITGPEEAKTSVPRAGWEGITRIAAPETRREEPTRRT